MSVRRRKTMVTFLPVVRAEYKNQKRVNFGTIQNLTEFDVLRAPIVRLEDNTGVIHSCKFDTIGILVMSAGADRNIYLNSVRDEHTAVTIFKGHTNTITEVQFSDQSDYIYSSSLDATLGVWDACKGYRISILRGHAAGVNSVQKSNHLICSGSYDGTIRLWDTRSNVCSNMFLNGSEVTCTCFNTSGDIVFSGGYDNKIKLYDVRMGKVVLCLVGHTKLVSGIALSPCGTKLLSNSRDSTARIWDLTPDISSKRNIATFLSNQNDNETNLLKCAWDRDNVTIAFGASDHCVHIWDISRNKQIHKIQAHASSVNDVDFNPLESVIASCSAYEHMYMHEI